MGQLLHRVRLGGVPLEPRREVWEKEREEAIFGG